ncbi:hypothetical protein BTR25_13395 [Bacillus sp. MRMR6]|nr:hypothetical protein BTR25_13395 [Bacillus sp. MRMR6]
MGAFLFGGGEDVVDGAFRRLACEVRYWKEAIELESLISMTDKKEYFSFYRITYRTIKKENEHR